MIPALEEAWQQAIRPTLTDLQGSAWFLSTPKGMNYFKTLFDRGQDPEREDWASWQLPSSANPYLESGEIEAARLDLTESAFNQEYLALFVNWEGSVFRRVGEAATAIGMTKPEPGHDYVIGCDWGRSNDYTVFMVLDTTTHSTVKIDRSNRVDYTVQCDRLKALSEQWQPGQIIAEQNSIGQPVIEQLTRDGLRIQPFTTTNASKAQAIAALALAFERGDIRILNDPFLVSELVAYQAEPLPSGLMRYGAPAGGHDDMVMSLALAWSAVSGQHRLIYTLPDRDIVIPEFPLPDHWPRAYGLDIRWHYGCGHLGRAGSGVGCAVSIQRVLWGCRPSRPSGRDPRPRGVDPRAPRSCGQRQDPSGWAAADPDLPEPWPSPASHRQPARVRNLGGVATHAFWAPEGLCLAAEIPGGAEALSA